MDLWTRCIYQLDLFSLSDLLKHIGFDTEKSVKKPKGPWVLSCIDMYSRYLETQYVGWYNKIAYVINAFIQIIMKMGMPIIVQADDEFNTIEFRAFCEEHGIYYFFWKPYENLRTSLLKELTRLSRNS